MTQSMTFSPYKKPFEERITKWDSQLNLVSEILDEWIALQRQWMYLEPIFSSDDIMQQLPLEGKRFASVDRTWRKVITTMNTSELVYISVGLGNYQGICCTMYSDTFENCLSIN